jgi:hypothetical protein
MSRSQGTFTGGIGPVAWGTKCDSCGRAMKAIVINAAIRIANLRMPGPSSGFRFGMQAIPGPTAPTDPENRIQESQM